MKIVYVTSSYDVIDQKFISSLKSSGNNLAVFVTKPRTIEDMEKVDNVDYYYNSYNPSDRVLYIFYYFYYFIKSLILIKKYVQSEKPDVMHGGNTQTAGFICALTGFHPFVLVTAGSDVLINPFKSSVFYRITNFVASKADSVICDAKIIKKTFLQITNYDKKIKIFPRGVDHKLFSPKKESSLRKSLNWDKRVIFVCTRAHYPVYGIEYLLKAFYLVSKFEKNFGLFLIDYNPKERDSQKSKYEKLIENFELNSHVEFLPPVSNDKISFYLNNSDVYISTSLSDGTSVSMLEAMACQLPIIVTDLPSSREWVKPNFNGFLPGKKDVVGIALSIIKLINSSTIRGQMAIENLKIARERADWDNHILTLQETYRELL